VTVHHYSLFEFFLDTLLKVRKWSGKRHFPYEKGFVKNFSVEMNGWKGGLPLRAG